VIKTGPTSKGPYDALMLPFLKVSLPHPQPIRYAQIILDLILLAISVLASISSFISLINKVDPYE